MSDATGLLGQGQGWWCYVRRLGKDWWPSVDWDRRTGRRRERRRRRRRRQSGQNRQRRLVTTISNDWICSLIDCISVHWCFWWICCSRTSSKHNKTLITPYEVDVYIGIPSLLTPEGNIWLFSCNMLDCFYMLLVRKGSGGLSEHCECIKTLRLNRIKATRHSVKQPFFKYRYLFVPCQYESD